MCHQISNSEQMLRLTQQSRCCRPASPSISSTCFSTALTAHRPYPELPSLMSSVTYFFTQAGTLWPEECVEPSGTRLMVLGTKVLCKK